MLGVVVQACETFAAFDGIIDLDVSAVKHVSNKIIELQNRRAITILAKDDIHELSKSDRYGRRAESNRPLRSELGPRRLNHSRQRQRRSLLNGPYMYRRGPAAVAQRAGGGQVEARHEGAVRISRSRCVVIRTNFGDDVCGRLAPGHATPSSASPRSPPCGPNNHLLCTAADAVARGVNIISWKPGCVFG